jgi:hypothetical protein
MKTVNDMLNDLDEFFLTAPKSDVVHLWDILAALRGPDDIDTELKTRTTARIRSLAFPRTAAYGAEDLPATFAQPGSGMPTLSPMEQGRIYAGHHSLYHFFSHIEYADTALRAIGRTQ